MDELKTLIVEALDIPVLDVQSVLTPPCVTLDPFQESPLIMGDGRAVKYVSSVQVTIWTQTRDEMMRKKGILRPLIEEKYTSPEISYGSDPESGLYRAVFDFQIMEV